MEKDQSKNEQTPLKDLEPEVKAKALEIEAKLKESDVPEGSTIEKEAVRQAQQWFLDMEG